MTRLLLSPATKDGAKAKFCEAFDCPGHTWLSHLQCLTPRSLDSVQRCGKVDLGTLSPLAQASPTYLVSSERLEPRPSIDRGS